MSFTFNTGIPATNNNPSADQPIMQANNAATSSILAVDHITFNNADGGKHQKITYVSTISPAPAAQVNPASIAYTANAQVALDVPTAIGSASATAQNFLKNQNGTFPLSAIKAFGVFTVTAGTVTFAPDMSFNVVDITKPSAQVYEINFVAGSIVGTVVVPLLTCTRNAPNYQWSYSANKLTITADTVVGGTKFSFAILQI